MNDPVGKTSFKIKQRSSSCVSFVFVYNDTSCFDPRARGEDGPKAKQSTYFPQNKKYYFYYLPFL